ncbi:MAG: hypothetical protein ACLFWG_04615 [Longimicrobiales bacterium]
MPRESDYRSRPEVYTQTPPLREDPFEGDRWDDDRVRFNERLWRQYDTLLSERDRQIELHLRMLMGQQWTVWSDTFGRWVDVTRWMDDEERRWRFLPVINRLLHWFMLLHARMTENPPVITFQPSSSDRIDAELAEVMDAIWKYLWDNTGMLERVDRLMGWLIPAGTAYLKSRIDPMKGEPEEFIGNAMLTLMGENGEPQLQRGTGRPIQAQAQGVPFDSRGEPQAELKHDETGNLVWEVTGRPHVQYEGGIAVDVLSPLEVRGTWGPQAWHEKPMHIQRTLLTPEQVFETFGVEVQPSITGPDAENASSFRRILHGSGFWGSASGSRVQAVEGEASDWEQGYVEVFESWHQPSRFPGTERTAQEPGGRLLITAGDKVVRDGQRYAPFPYMSPYREFQFVGVPGRPGGTSPEEMLVGPQRTYNRLVSQILQHTTLVGNPIRVIDNRSGIDADQVSNRPNLTLEADLSKLEGNAPIMYIDPPQMTGDVWRTSELLVREFNEIGNVSGAEGTPPHDDASGELVKELRFNSDRFIGPTMRRAVVEMARLGEDWQVMLPLIWDQEKVISVAGEDMAATTVTVYPQLFKAGKVNVRPDVESMLPEGRGERQGRMFKMWQSGAFGPPDSPAAIKKYLDLARFPHMGRAVRPGGIHRIMAEHNVGKILQGTPAMQVPVFEWYNHEVHLEVLEEYMASPEYLKQDVGTQQQFVVYRQVLRQAALATLQQEMMLQGAIQDEANEVARAVGPPPGAEEQNRGRPGPQTGPPDRGATATALPA